MWPRSVRNLPHVSSDRETPSRRHSLLLTVTAAGGVALLSALVARLDVDEQWPLDHRIRAALSRRRASRTRTVLRMGERAGTAAVYAPATALAMAYVGWRRGAPRAAPIGVAVAGGAALGLALKYLVRRPRPAGSNGPVNTHPSFPSGHATRATALVGILAYVAIRERVAPPLVSIPMAAAIALTTGVSRAYADAHWTTDVVGGWATGITAAAGAALLYERARAAAHR